jgi:non-heme chloroperoxidase
MPIDTGGCGRSQYLLHGGDIMNTRNRDDFEETDGRSDSRRAFMLGAAALGAGLVAGCSPEQPPRPGRSRGRITAPGQFITSDGAMLNFIEAGSGTPLVLIPDWSQTAAMFRAQIDAFSANHRVIAVDMRGHGGSSKTSYGYRIARLALDVNELMEALELDNATIAGHSMGCSVIWSYWDQFGGQRISKIILIDQAPTVVFWPDWTDEQKQVAGALFDAKGLYDTAAGIAGADGAKVTEDVVRGLFFTKAYPKEKADFALAENMKFPRQHAARLLVDHCTARHDSAHRRADPGGRRQGELFSPEVAGMDRQPDRRRAGRNLRRGRGRRTLHVHGEPGEVQSHRGRVSRLIASAPTTARRSRG